MPKPPNHDCALCAQHSTDWARANFSRCWDDKDNHCHARRSFYRRKQRAQAPLTGAAPPATVVVPVLLLYKHGSRLHAVGGRLERGGEILCAPAPVHVEGWTEGQVKKYAADLLHYYSELAGETFTQFKSSYSPSALPCLIPNCLLKASIHD